MAFWTCTRKNGKVCLQCTWPVVSWQISRMFRRRCDLVFNGTVMFLKTWASENLRLQLLGKDSTCGLGCLEFWPIFQYSRDAAWCLAFDGFHLVWNGRRCPCHQELTSHSVGWNPKFCWLDPLNLFNPFYFFNSLPLRIWMLWGKFPTTCTSFSGQGHFPTIWGPH